MCARHLLVPPPCRDKDARLFRAKQRPEGTVYEKQPRSRSEQSTETTLPHDIYSSLHLQNASPAAAAAAGVIEPHRKTDASKQSEGGVIRRAVVAGVPQVLVQGQGLGLGLVL